jgi:nucleotidyltransferase substrate binding protein (TIGR01987 family)
MKNKDRWIQRLQNLNKALVRLDRACDQDVYSELEVAGLVQTFEFTFELCWKTLKDKLNYEGYDANSPREVFLKAAEMGLLTDHALWLEALESRNIFSHAYDNEIAEQAIELIKEKFTPVIRVCVARLNEQAAEA